MKQRDRSSPSETPGADAGGEARAVEDWACLDDFGELLRLEPGETPGTWELLDDADDALTGSNGAQLRPALQDYPEFYRHLAPTASLPDWLGQAGRIERLEVDFERIRRLRLRVDRATRALVPLALRWMRRQHDLPLVFELIDDPDLAPPQADELLLLVPGDSPAEAWLQASRLARRRDAQVVALLERDAEHAARLRCPVIEIPLPNVWNWLQCGAFSGHLFALYALGLRLGAPECRAPPDPLQRAARAVHADVLRLPSVWSAVRSAALDIASAGRLVLLGRDWGYELCSAYAPLIRRLAGAPCIALGPERAPPLAAPGEIVPVLALAAEQQLPEMVERLALLPDAHFRKILATNAADATASVDAAICSVKPVPVGGNDTAPIGFSIWLQMLSYQLGRAFASISDGSDPA